MTPEMIAMLAVIIRMGIQLGIDMIKIIKDAGFNDADVEKLCTMVDEARDELRKPTE